MGYFPIIICISFAGTIEGAHALLDQLMPDLPVLIPHEELQIVDTSVDRSTPIGRFRIMHKGRPVIDRVFETQAAARLWLSKRLVNEALPLPARVTEMAVPIEKRGDKSWAVH